MTPARHAIGSVWTALQAWAFAAHVLSLKRRGMQVIGTCVFQSIPANDNLMEGG